MGILSFLFGRTGKQTKEQLVRENVPPPRPLRQPPPRPVNRGPSPGSKRLTMPPGERNSLDPKYGGKRSEPAASTSTSVDHTPSPALMFPAHHVSEPSSHRTTWHDCAPSPSYDSGSSYSSSDSGSSCSGSSDSGSSSSCGGCD